MMLERVHQAWPLVAPAQVHDGDEASGWPDRSGRLCLSGHPDLDSESGVAQAPLALAPDPLEPLIG